MEGIHAFLKKFTFLDHGNAAVKKATIEGVCEYTGITLAQSEITVRDGVVYIKTKPIKKNEITLKKEGILSHIKENIPSNINIYNIV